MNKKISLAIMCPMGISIQGMVCNAVNTTFYIADGVIVILWIVTGILFLVASGDPAKLTLARKALFAAIIGTILIIVANSAVYLVGGAFGI